MQAVLDDRPAQREPVLLAVAALLARARGLLGRRFCPPIRLRIGIEGPGLELVGAGPGHRRDRGARNLVVLGLVVRRDDLVLGDGELRERVARIADGILVPAAPWVRNGAGLPRDAARPHVVLLPDAVDIDVGRPGIERPAADLRVALGIDRELHARHRVGELEEVARDLRRDLDLAHGNAAADLRGLDLVQPRGVDHDLFGCAAVACAAPSKSRVAVVATPSVTFRWVPGPASTW